MFGKGTRYTTTALLQIDTGSYQFRGVGPRIPPATEGIVEHAVSDTDRPDALAHHFYGNDRLWWRLLDANANETAASATFPGSRSRLVLSAWQQVVAQDLPLHMEYADYVNSVSKLAASAAFATLRLVAPSRGIFVAVRDQHLELLAELLRNRLSGSAAVILSEWPEATVNDVILIPRARD